MFGTGRVLCIMTPSAAGQSLCDNGIIRYTSISFAIKGKTLYNIISPLNTNSNYMNQVLLQSVMVNFAFMSFL